MVAVTLAGRRWDMAVAGVLGLRLLPAEAWPRRAAVAPPWWDLPARALAALALVLALTAVSGALGAHLSGLLAPFPVISSVLAVFTHAHGGFAQVNVLLRNSFGLATAMALAVQATIFLLRSRLLPVPLTPSTVEAVDR